MTSQTLIAKSLSELSSSESARQAPSAYSSNASGSSVYLLESRRSPYQGDQQIELQHLQAETEALLRQLQDLKQKRSAAQPQP